MKAVHIIAIVSTMAIILLSTSNCAPCPPNEDLIRCPFRITALSLAGC